MKRIYALVVLAICAVLFSSCSKNKALNCVPQNADAVYVVCPDKNFNEDIDKTILDDVFKELDIEGQEMEFMKRMIQDPKSSGLDFSKAMVAWVEVGRKDVEKSRFGMAIPLKDVEKFQSSLSELNNLIGDSYVKLSNIKQQGDISYVCPLQDDEEQLVIGWNKSMLVIIGSPESRVTPADVESAIHRDKGSSILSNSDFKKFSKDLTNLNLWVKTDVFVDVFEKELDSEFKDFVSSADINLRDNYFHAHITMDKKEYKLEMSFQKNESLQNIDMNKLWFALKKIIKERKNQYSRYNDFDTYSRYDDYDSDYDSYYDSYYDIDEDDYYDNY